MLGAASLAAESARDPGVEIILRAGERIGGKPVACIPGRSERADPQYAATATGYAAASHPGAASFAAVIASLPQPGLSGYHLLKAFALGCEIQVRLDTALGPSHGAAGWDIAGTAGVLGAATAVAVLFELEVEAMRNALAIAASMTVGHRAGAGTMMERLHPGKAAANGMLAARLARLAFTGPPDAFEAPRGFANLLSPDHDFSSVEIGIGKEYVFAGRAFGAPGPEPPRGSTRVRASIEALGEAEAQPFLEALIP